ncbi:hypothetical protein DOY81_005751 [Sarcophaga bullata]|nr:hypothetical protein DOY81_005751 [Sarcophaga bullata]
MLPIKYPCLLGVLLLFSMLIGSAWSATLDSITQTEIVQTKQLKKHLEVLKGHLEDTIQKLEHNIKARQTQFRNEALTPDSEYIEAALATQGNNDFIRAASVPETPLPSQKMRINQNSGLRRKRSHR